MKKVITALLVAAILFCASGGSSMAYQSSGQKDTSVQARGIWHRPNATNEETTLEGIRSVLDKFQYAGINLVFLEVFYHGRTVFKTSTVEYYTGFDKYDYGEYPDYLSAFTAEAAKRNIEVHAWVEDFYIGVTTNNFVKYCSQWLLLNSKGEYRQSEGADYGGYIFLDPANVEVRKFLVNFYSEILTKFPTIKGLNLDYIRYPVSSTNDDTGFTKAAMTEFADECGWTLADDKISTFISKLNSTGSHSNFTRYRANKVTTFVEEVYTMVKEKHPSVLLSTAIFPEPSLSYNEKKQDFTAWLNAGYLDIVTPMAYYDNNTTLKNALNTMMKDCDGTYCYAGLSSTYHSLSNSQVLGQLAVCDSVGTDGFIFFGSQSILENDGYIELLHSSYGSTTETDITPHSNILSLINTIAYPLVNSLLEKSTTGEENEARILELKDDLDEISALGEGSLSALREVENKLELLTKYNLQAYVSSANLAQAKESLELLHRYVSVYGTRAKLKGILPENPPKEDNDQPPDEPAPEQPPAEEPDLQPETPEAPADGSGETDDNLEKIAAITAGTLGTAATAAVAAVLIKRKKD